MRQLNRVRRRKILPASIKAIEDQVDISTNNPFSKEDSMVEKLVTEDLEQ